MARLLRCRPPRDIRGRKSTPQSIHNGAGLEQLRAGGQQCRLSLFYRFFRCLQVRPGGRNKRARAIGQYQRQMKLAASMSPAEHIQRPALEGMALTNDGYLVGISGEVVVMGSLSSGSLTILTTIY
jgi:hypothetical protein